MVEPERRMLYISNDRDRPTDGDAAKQEHLPLMSRDGPREKRRP